MNKILCPISVHIDNLYLYIIISRTHVHLYLKFHIDRKRCEKQGRKIASCHQAENWKFCYHDDSFEGLFIGNGHRHSECTPFPRQEPRFISILGNLPISRKQRVKLSNDNGALERANMWFTSVWICYFKIEFARGQSCQEISTINPVKGVGFA